MFSAELSDKSKFPKLANAAKAAHDVLTKLTVDCQSQHHIRAGDPALIGLAMWTMVHGLALLLMDRQVESNHLDSKSIKKLTSEVKQYLWAGLDP